MPTPEGTITAAQHEILETIWDGPQGGLTVAEIWQLIGESREISRTTVLNQVDRLEKRGWLKRKKSQSGYRYLVTQSRAKTTRQLAEEFVESFFGGSTSELVMSLLGPKKLKPKDVDRLRDLLDGKSSDSHGSNME